MKKIAKILLIVVVVLIVLLGVGMFALNRYVQSPQFKDYVLAKTQEQVTVPLQVESLKVSLLEGFELRGLVVNNPPGSQKPALLTSKALVFRYRLWPLLHKKIEIETITVDSANITLEKLADGSWTYEKLTKEQPKEAKTGDSGTPKEPEASAPPSGLAFEISNLKVADLNLLFLKPEGKKLLEVNALNVQSSVSGSGQSLGGKGELKIQRAAVIDSLELRDVQSPLVVEQQQLKLPDLTAKIEDGTLKGNVLVDLQKDGYPFTVHADVADVDVAKIGARFSDKAQYLTGKLQLTTDVAGVGGDTNKLKGKGNAHIVNGTLAGIPLLQTIGGLLNIPQLERIQFDEITLEYAMDNGVIDTPVIKLLSKDIQLTGSGKTDFDFNLDHQFTLALSPAIMAKVPKEVKGAFGSREDGFSIIDFKVTGPSSSPKTDLTDKLVKGAASSFLGEFLGGVGEKKKKKKTQ